MKRKLISAVLVLLMVMVLIPWSAMAASSGTCGAGVSWTLDEENVLTISGRGEMADCVSEYVQPWYQYRGTIKEIVIQSGVTGIGDYAFNGCNVAEKVTIPDSVKVIGRNAFAKCGKLTNVTIPEGVIGLGDYAFLGCTSLKQIELPMSLKKIGSTAFANCAFSEIILPENVENIGEGAFFNCRNLTEIVLPEGIMKIADHLFEECNKLEKVTIPSTVTSIGANAFSYCALQEIVIPKGVRNIGKSAFSDCSSLTKVVLPENLTALEESVFIRCGALADVTIPKSVTRIDKFAFYECKSLTSMTIPNGVTDIGEGAFSYCEKLKSVSMADSVTNMGSRVFEKCSALAEVRLSKGLTAIAPSTFLCCPSLTKITIPEKVTRIEDNAFLGCKSLPRMTIPKGVTYMGMDAFGECYALEYVAFKGNAPMLDWGVFSEDVVILYYPKGNTTWTDEIKYFCEMDSCAAYVMWVECSDMNLLTPVVAAAAYGGRVEVLWNKVENAQSYTVYRKEAGGNWKSIKKGLTSGVYYDETIVPGKTYYYTVRAVNGTKLSSFASSNGVRVLASPVVKASVSAKGVQVSWTKVDGAEGYMVLRSTDGVVDEGYQVILGNSWLDTSVQSGKTYQYAVVAVGQTEVSEPGESANIFYLKTPTVTAANTAGGVKVSWDAIDGAASYKLYRKTTGGSWVAIKSGLTGTSYTDTTAKSGTTYSYTVRAVKGSSLSSFVGSKAIKRLTEPVITLANAATGAKISWNKVAGADGYEVFRSANGTSWTKIKTTTSTSYTDTAASAGKTYYYTVKAYDKSTGKTIYSSCDKTKKTIRLKQPAVTMANTSTGVKISWAKITGADGYQVYRSTDGKSWTKIVQTTSLSYTDTAASAGKTYYYTVKAYDKSTGKTIYSSCDKTKKIIRLKQPATKVTAVTGGVKVSWAKITGADGYLVYRSNDGKTWTKLKQTTALSYTDKTAVKGKNFYYTVKAFDKSTGQTVYSSIKSSSAVKRTK